MIELFTINKSISQQEEKYINISIIYYILQNIKEYWQVSITTEKDYHLKKYHLYIYIKNNTRMEKGIICNKQPISNSINRSKIE